MGLLGEEFIHKQSRQIEEYEGGVLDAQFFRSHSGTIRNASVRLMSSSFLLIVSKTPWALSAMSVICTVVY
jgi:peptidoglycan hydrolase-like amidase